MSENMFDMHPKGKVFLAYDNGAFSTVVFVKREGDDNKPEIINLNGTSDGAYGMRSLIYVSPEGEILIGDQVTDENLETNDPAGVITSPKMLLLDGDLNKKITVNGHEFSVFELIEKLVSYTFEKVQSELEYKGIYDIHKICAGVPATFPDSAKQAYVNIFEKLGYTDVQLLVEPDAAAVAASYETGAELMDHIMVLDWGAGTFDVTLLEKNENPSDEEPYPYIIKDIFGNCDAGDLFDERMLELMVANAEVKEPGNAPLKVPDKGTNSYRLILKEARGLKENLSKIKRKPGDKLKVRFIYNDETNEMKVTAVSREEFENSIRDILSASVDEAYKIAKKHGLDSQQFSVVMVGGTSKMPIVKETVRKKFSWLDDKMICNFKPETAIAKGCALYAEKPAFGVKFNHAYGFLSKDYHMGLGVDILIPPLVKLPYTDFTKYKTRHDKQTGMLLEFFETVHGQGHEFVPISVAKAVGYHVFHDFGQEVPKGTVVDVAVTMNKNGIVEVEITDEYGHTTRDNLNIGVSKA